MTITSTGQQKAHDQTRTIHPSTRMGHVHYTTPDIDTQIAFYRDILGFKLHWREGDSAGLGAGKADLLRLTEDKNARRARRTTGLYHTAFLVPTRWDLAHLLKRIAETRTPIEGMTNHGTHYAIYLPDADENGIELAWDFPKDQWPRTIQEMMARNRALPPAEVFRALNDSTDEWQGLDAGTQVGHVHLHVSRLPQTEQFYADVLGFDKSMELPDSATFFSAGGYHHHIGTNVWQGVGAPPPPANAIGLRYFSVILPDQAELDRVVARLDTAGLTTASLDNGILVRDPAQNGVLLTVGTT